MLQLIKVYLNFLYNISASPGNNGETFSSTTMKAQQSHVLTRSSKSFVLALAHPEDTRSSARVVSRDNEVLKDHGEVTRIGYPKRSRS